MVNTLSEVNMVNFLKYKIYLPTYIVNHDCPHRGFHWTNKPKSHLQLLWLTKQSCVAFYPCLFCFIRRPTGIKTSLHLYACVYSRSLAFLTHTSALLSQAVNPLAGRDETCRSDEIGCNEEEKWLALWCASRVVFACSSAGRRLAQAHSVLVSAVLCHLGVQSELGGSEQLSHKRVCDDICDLLISQ